MASGAPTSVLGSDTNPSLPNSFFIKEWRLDADGAWPPVIEPPKTLGLVRVLGGFALVHREQTWVLGPGGETLWQGPTAPHLAEPPRDLFTAPLAGGDGLLLKHTIKCLGECACGDGKKDCFQRLYIERLRCAWEPS